MQDLLARILCSVAADMWRKDPTLGRYSAETAEHELNLAFHYAAELRRWFRWLDCDFDVQKTGYDNQRPDIILHRRKYCAPDFLIIEIKRWKAETAADLQKIRDKWFSPPLSYRYGASVWLDDSTQDFGAKVLSRENPIMPVVVSKMTMGNPLRRPKAMQVRSANLRGFVRKLVRLDRRPIPERIPFEEKVDAGVRRLYDLPGNEIKLVEESNSGEKS